MGKKSPTPLPCGAKYSETAQPCPHALAAADMAVEKTFAIFGVNIHDPKQVKEFQASLWFSDRLRRIADKSMSAVIIATVLFLLGAVGLGLKQKILGGP